ncbi:MAG TPA: prephenate dehydrogenase/arogenate dehydrogenase family protein, partial [Longimicrobiales bacterium]|nr:prephenate dehydrogenase/arogenate dehydrogenase family protein [Longimicrobiales bacterium]
MTDQVAIIGLGLIGGSLARDLAARGVQLIGYDLDARALRAALDENVIARALSSDLEGIEAADVVVLALPVQVAPAVLAAVAGRVGHAHLITDVGSTKSGIVAAAERLGLGERFIGGHPLAGDHSSGWSASRRELFRGARVFLCPGALTRPDVLDRARALWTLV